MTLSSPRSAGSLPGWLLRGVSWLKVEVATRSLLICFPAVASCRLQSSDGGSPMGGSLRRLSVHPLAEQFGLVGASNQ